MHSDVQEVGEFKNLCARLGGYCSSICTLTLAAFATDVVGVATVGVVIAVRYALLHVQSLVQQVQKRFNDLAQNVVQRPGIKPIFAQIQQKRHLKPITDMDKVRNPYPFTAPKQKNPPSGNFL